MELGYLHNIIQEFIESNDKNKNGSISSGISYCFHEEICVYYDSINKLQKEVNNLKTLYSESRIIILIVLNIIVF